VKIYHFPFSAILGQDNMKLALLLNVIDPKIGGVLLTGQQGTGKSTAVRSLVELLPKIDIHEGCAFNCDPQDHDNQCSFCKSESHPAIKKPIGLINLPLGATEDMVIGSLDIEKIIREGKREIQPGLLAKAHRGILYVDEINLLQDHLVDILLDVSASGVNVIEREGISLMHPARFILVGSMNPEEGELRPQISDRLGLEVPITAPGSAQLRAEITRRVLAFNDNPEIFCQEFVDEQSKLRLSISNAKQIISEIKIPIQIYQFAAELVLKLKLYSQRADLTFVRCARAHAALRGSKLIEKEDLQRALYLVFEHRMKRYNENVPAEFLGETFEEIYGKIKEAIEDSHIYEATENEAMKTYKFSPDIKDKFHENPLNKENRHLPEVDQGNKPSKDRHSNFQLGDDLPDGFKAGDEIDQKPRIYTDWVDALYTDANTQLKMDVSPILDFLKSRKRITNYVGRGSRIRVLTYTMGRYILARRPRGLPHRIAFDATIKHHFLNYHSNQYQINTPELDPTPSLAIPLDYSDVYEKLHELKAPFSLYFIVDASNSMVKTLEQIVKVIQSVHSEGYKKKDKLAVLSFQGRESHILQRPSVSFNVALTKLRQLQATSYTPLASALRKTLTMITQERIKGSTVPVILIMSDLGANVSQKYPDLKAQNSADFALIEQEIDEITQEIGKKGIKVILMKPQKGWATRFLGVNPQSVEKIQESFLRHTAARLFEFDAYDPEGTIIQLKRVIG
jgi:magnesium chelatase subunit D